MKKCRSMIIGIFFLALCVSSCGDEFDALVAPGQGLISINGSTPQPFVISNVFVANKGVTSTITLNHSLALNFGTNDVMTINLIVPNGQVGVNIDLSTTMSNMMETTTDSGGNVLSTDFSSTMVTGTIYLQDLTPNSTAGTFNANFTDGMGNSRAITNGSFVLYAN